MALLTTSHIEGETTHYRLDGENSLEIISRISELRKDAHRDGGRCCATTPHLMPNGRYRSAVWIDPQN